MLNLKDKYGQVFLKDELVANKICDLIPLGQNLIEIGFGDLFLTKRIVSRVNYKTIYLYEIDKFFFNKNFKVLNNISNSKLFNVDFIDEIINNRIDSKKKFILVSNIAFNIFKKTITELILNNYFNIQRIIVLIPKDIGVSILKENCAFAKFISFFYKSNIEFDIYPNSFERFIPFKTCIINMTVNIEEINYININNINVSLLYTFIKNIFNNKRKILKLKSNINKLRPHELSHKLILHMFKDYNDEFN